MHALPNNYTFWFFFSSWEYVIKNTLLWFWAEAAICFPSTKWSQGEICDAVQCNVPLSYDVW